MITAEEILLWGITGGDNWGQACKHAINYGNQAFEIEMFNGWLSGSYIAKCTNANLTPPHDPRIQYAVEEKTVQERIATTYVLISTRGILADRNRIIKKIQKQ